MRLAAICNESKWTTSCGLGLLQMVSDSDTERCASEDVGPSRGVDCANEDAGPSRAVDCEISHQLEREQIILYNG